MTAIAALVGARATQCGDEVLRMLASMPGRGDLPRAEQVSQFGALGAAVFDWQRPWAGDGVGRCGDVSVAADATLYHRDALHRAIRTCGVSPASMNPADLIAAAIECWQDDAVNHLDGDFAFIAIDTRRGTLLAARDWGATRSLYWTRSSCGFALATELPALERLDGVDRSLNLPWLCEAATGRFESPNETIFRGISVLPAGHVLSLPLEAGASPAVRRFFSPPRFLGDDEPALSFDEAARELRRLLEAAVAERIPASGDVVVSLSGGRDSTAVYALARRLAGSRIRSVTVSFPVGDPGRDDEIVADVLRACGGETRWIDSTSLGVLASIEEEAAARPEPFGHPFAEFQVAIAGQVRALGGRVLLSGNGGDQFFSGEPTYLADLLRRGRLLRLLSEWRALGEVKEWRAFFKLAVWPNLGPTGHRLVAALRRGRQVLDPFDRPIAPWISREPTLSEELERRHRQNFPSRAEAAGAEDFERRWLLTHPYFHRVFAELFRIYLGLGVEVRSPLTDLGVMRFAATRPRWERRQGWDMKRLLRHSLNDVLPQSVTGPRARPTGTTDALMRGAIRTQMPRYAAWFRGGGSHLARLGVLNDQVLASQVDSVLRGAPNLHAMDAVYAVLAESWLSVHYSGPAQG